MKRSFYSVVLGIMFANFLTGAWFGYQSSQKSQAAPKSQAASAVSAASPMPHGDLRESAHRVMPGESFYQALSQMEVPESLTMEWMDLAKPLYDISMIRSGQKMSVKFDSSGTPVRLDLEINKTGTSHLVISKNDNGGYEAELIQQEPAQTTEKLKPQPVGANPQRYYRGTVETNLYQAAIDAGMDPELAMNLPRIFAAQGSYVGRMKKGDRFAVLTENLPSGDEKIMAAQILVGKKSYRSFYFESGGEPGYFDEKGRAWEGFQMMKPVKNARISSTYSYHRFHPILGYYTPHLAVDYAAPQGTPVKAAATGVIAFAGWRGGYGNYIEIRHNSTYTTTYGHMRNLAAGIRSGTRVKQGQVIGYVGMTGLATGPHLDYRIIKNGGSIDPLKFKGIKLKMVSNPVRFARARIAMEIEMESFRQALEQPRDNLILVADLSSGK